MNNTGGSLNIGRIRLIVFAAASALHIIIILNVAISMKTVVKEAEPVAGIMKLVDVQEQLRLQPPPERPPELPEETQSAIAETMIETTETPPPVSPFVYGPVQERASPEQIDYLPQHRITLLPVLPEDEIVRAMVYPPIAQRSNIEGTVFLEIFIDRQGIVRDVRVLRENPPDRGFGEAAVKAFKGIKGKPAEANGVPVAVRYRYSLRFQLK